MARIRSIKPEFFLSEKVGGLSMAARVFFVGLFTQADREGRIEWAPKRLKVQIFPYDDLDIGPLAAELVAAGLARTYRSGETWCLDLPGFVTHQRPHPKEAGSVLPACPAEWQTHGEPWNYTASREMPGSIPSCPAGKGREGDLGREGKGAAARVSASPERPKRQSYGDPHGQRLDPTAAGFITAGEGQLIAIPGAWATRACHDYGLTLADIDAFATWAKDWIASHGFEDGGNRWKWLDARLADWRQARKGDASSEALAAATQQFIAEQQARRAHAEPVADVLAALKAGYAGH